jgi:hypothetical protein
MSDIVGGGISRGRGNNQVTLGFAGRLNDAQWAAFVQCVVQCAQKFGVAVNDVTVTLLTQPGAAKKKASKKKGAAKK